MSDPIDKLEQHLEALDDENDALARTLHDLKTYVENVPIDAVRYPDTVRELLDRAETLIGGEVPAIIERGREAEAEAERLRRAVEDAARRFSEIATPNLFASPVEDRIKIAESARGRMEDALDGGGESSQLRTD